MRIAALALVVLAVGCARQESVAPGEVTAEQAKQRLAELHMPLTREGFLGAARAENVEALRLYDVAGLKPDERGWTEEALRDAVTGRRNITIRVLAPRVQRASADTLIATIDEGQLDLVAQLAAHADVNGLSRTGERPLQAAAAKNWLEAVELLVNRGATVEPDGGNPTALAAAAGARSGREDARTVQFLLAHGAVVNRRSGDGKTPALRAAEALASANLAALIAAGADLGIRDDQGHSTLGVVMSNLSESESLPRAHALAVLVDAADKWTVEEKRRQADHDLESVNGRAPVHGFQFDEATMVARLHVSTVSYPVTEEELPARCRDIAYALGLGSVPLTKIELLMNGTPRGTIRFDRERGFQCEFP